MASPVKKKQKFSFDISRPICSTAIGENEQQQKSIGKRPSLFRVAKKMNKHRILRKIWICADVLMDIFPFFDRPQLGFKLALLSPRFDALVDAHFDAKSEWTIWTPVELRKNRGSEPKLRVFSNSATNSMHFPLPDRPLPDKIRFRFLRIEYINHSAITFLHANKHIWDKSGINLYLSVWSYKSDMQRIWDVLVREIWPIFATNIHHLSISYKSHLDNLCSRTSPTILTDLLNINSIYAASLCPDVTMANVENVPNPTATQILAKWLHAPSKDGKPKRLQCKGTANAAWVNSFKEPFLRANSSSACYIILFFALPSSKQIVPFELVNERTNEKLTLNKTKKKKWLLKRCKIGQMVQWDDQRKRSLVNVNIRFNLNKKCIGRLFPPAAAAQSGGKGRQNVRK